MTHVCINPICYFKAVSQTEVRESIGGQLGPGEWDWDAVPTDPHTRSLLTPPGWRGYYRESSGLQDQLKIARKGWMHVTKMSCFSSVFLNNSSATWLFYESVSNANQILSSLFYGFLFLNCFWKVLYKTHLPSLSPSLSSHVFNLLSFLFSSPFRQNPVPEESCARRGHEAAAFYRRLLQGKHPQILSLTLGNIPPGLWGVKSQHPYCSFTCCKDGIWDSDCSVGHRKKVPVVMTCVSELFWDIWGDSNVLWHWSFSEAEAWL